MGNKSIKRRKLKILSVILIFLFFSTNFVFAGNVTLFWYPNSEPDLAGYRIYYGTSPRTDNCPPGGYQNKIDVGKTNTPENPSFTIDNLEEGKTYYFSLTSYDIHGNESCFSVEIRKALPKTKFSLFDPFVFFKKNLESFKPIYSLLNFLKGF